ncbi:hypothetical protein QL285_086256 [Trifolium repens]|nr:hypothetical protein QL285_086256 [Trifolium repens]
MPQITEKDKWLKDIQEMLIFSQSRSIYLVPEGLKKGNEDTYMPRVVSIGPRFNGSRQELLLMEEVKLSCMFSLLCRRTGPIYGIMEKCSLAVWELDKAVRASYVEKIELTQSELAKMMLLDGCFLLELLISKGLDSQLKSRFPCPAAEVLKDEDVLSDLMLFENQIPILVLDKLSQTIFPNEFEPDEKVLYGRYAGYDYATSESKRHENIIKRGQRAKKINNLTLQVLGYSPLDSPCPEAPHILDLVHFFVNRTIESTTMPEPEKDHSELDIINTTQTQKQQLTLKRCALRLLTSGVAIKVKLASDKDSTGFGALSCFSLVWKSLSGMLFKLCNVLIVNGKHLNLDNNNIHEEVQGKGLDFYFEFEKEKGKLEIEQLHLTKTTKAKWCNLIAWENHKKYRGYSSFLNERQIYHSETNITSATVSSGGHGGGGKFTWAALIFNGLICSEDDVQLLKDKHIIVDHLKMSNKELFEFFRKIQYGISHGGVDSSSYYAQMVDDINNFSKVFFIRRIWRTVWNSFTYRQEWFVRFLNHNYNFVATVISLCTVVQTIYAIIAYQLPKN